MSNSNRRFYTKKYYTSIKNDTLSMETEKTFTFRKEVACYNTWDPISRNIKSLGLGRI